MLSRIESVANYLYWWQYHLKERMKEEEAVEALEWLVIMVAIVAFGAALAKILDSGGTTVGSALTQSLKKWAEKVGGK